MDSGTIPNKVTSIYISNTDTVDDTVVQLNVIKTEVQGLKEKNIKKVPNDPLAPQTINVKVKKDTATDWTAANLQEEYTVNLDFTNTGKVKQYGG
jgi:hypothetical protein